MPYALNLFNLIPGREDQYRRYSVLAGKIIYGLGGQVIVAGERPLRHLHGDIERRHMIVVEFPSHSAFQQFFDAAERQGIHELREGATTDYLWTLFERWDLRAWVKQSGVEAPEQKAASRGARDAAARRPLVLLPGLLCDRALWRPQIDALSDICQPWVGDLTRDDTIGEMAARILAEAPSKSFALAALSMGGYVAMEIMRQAPQRVQRVALLDTRAGLDTPEETERRHELIRLAQTERGFTPITGRMLPVLIHPARARDEALVAVIREMAERTGVDGYVRQQRAIMSRPDFRPYLMQIQCPTIVLCGRDDALTPVAMHDEMARLIPSARLVIVEQCGHLSTLERPVEVNAALRDWLAE
jgi:pimeloyl-ACP methyl ester carboxylesterase